MDFYRLKHTIGMCLQKTAVKRAAYLKKHGIFYHMGDNCMTMFRKIPLYPKLISFGNNVWVASNVSFVTHDVIHRMMNNKMSADEFQEHVGCIDIKDNVFIGANTTVLSNVQIGENTIIAAGSVVNKSIPGNGVYAGVPARFICTFDDFINKRNQISSINILHGKGGLSESTIDECWKRFEEMEKSK